VAWAAAYLHTKWHLNPSSRLANGENMGLCPFKGVLVAIKRNVAWAEAYLIPYQVVS